MLYITTDLSTLGLEADADVVLVEVAGASAPRPYWKLTPSVFAWFVRKLDALDEKSLRAKAEAAVGKFWPVMEWAVGEKGKLAYACEETLRLTQGAETHGLPEPGEVTLRVRVGGTAGVADGGGKAPLANKSPVELPSALASSGSAVGKNKTTAQRSMYA